MSEAHNTIIDFATQGGLLAVVCILVIFYIAYKGVSSNIVASAGVVVLFAFTMAHFVGRQPIYYLYMIMFICIGIRYLERATNSEGYTS